MTTTEADGAYAFDELLWGTYAIREAQLGHYGAGTGALGHDGSVQDLFGDIDLLPDMPGTHYDLGEVFIDDGVGEVGIPNTPAGTDAPSDDFFTDLLEGTCQIASAGLPAGHVTGTNHVGPPGGSITVDMLGTDLPADTSALEFGSAGPVPSSDSDLGQTPVVAPAGLIDTLSGFGPSASRPEPDATVAPRDIPAEQGTARLGAVDGSATGEISADSFTRIALQNGGTGLDDGFAEIQPADLRGVVWVADGELEDEPGMFSVAGKAGVVVHLTGTDDRGRPASRTTKSDADGRYAFEGLYPGEYAVQVATPRGFRSVEARPGNKGGMGQAKKQIDEIRLNPGDDASGYEFYYEGTGQLAGRVAGRPGRAARTVGMGGVAVVLTGTGRDGRAIQRTTTTDAKGKYLFHALPPGTYRVDVMAEPDKQTWSKSPAQVNGRPAGVAVEDAVAVEGILLGADGRATGLDFTAGGGAG